MEDLLAPLLSRSQASEGITRRIEISAGRLDVFDEQNTSIARLDAIQAVVTPADAAARRNVAESSSEGGGTVALQSCRIATPQGIGSLAGSLSWKPKAHSTDWTLTTRAEAFDMSLLRPLARRWGVAVDVQGALDLHAEAAWESASSRWTVELEQADARLLRLTAPAWLGQDQLVFDRFQARGSYAFVHDTWRVTNGQIQCDAGRLSLNGQFTWPLVSPVNAWNQLLASAATADLQMAGRADLARLAASLPHTLRIRADSVIESGTVEFELAGQGQAADRRWTAHLMTSELAARRGGQRITWNDPLQVTLAAQLTAEQWRLERFTCSSSALSVALDGTPAAGSFDLQCDVAQLVSQLREFIDVGSLTAAGNLTARLDWQCGDDHRITIDGTGLVEHFDLSAGESSRWQEPRLNVTLAMQGERGGERGARIDSARLQLQSSSDRLDLQLLEPVESPGMSSVWMMDCSLQGQWSSWLARLRPILPSTSLLSDGVSTIEGPLDLRLTARVTPQSLDIDRGTLRSEPLHVSTPHISIREKVVAAEWKGRWEPGTGRLSIPEGTLQSEALALRVTDLRVDPAAGHARWAGDMAFRADLEKLYSQWRIPAKQQDWRVGGSAQGSLSLILLGDTTQARWAIDLVSVDVARRAAAATTSPVMPATSVSPWQTVWREPILKLSGSAQYDFSAQSVALERLDVTSDDRFGLSVRGTVVQPIGACTLDVQGQVTYDLAKLLQQVVPQWNTPVKFTGQDTQPFELRGPLFHPTVASTQGWARQNSPATEPVRGIVPHDLSGRAGLRWQSAELLGITLGSASLQAKLAAGAVDLGVVEMPLSGGMLRMQPTVDLNSQRPVITLAPGQVLTDVQITAGMCDGWLKYVAPVAADATRAEGQFSMSLQRATIPIGNPAAINTVGTLSIKSAQLAAGPLTQQLLQMVGYLGSVLPLQIPSTTSLAQDAWVRIPPQTTQLQVVNSRVHHDSLTFESGNVVLRTRGSVGFDQTLALVAEVPIRDEWIAGDRRLEALRGSSVEIPISGTLLNPRLDRRALERLATDTLRKTTQQALQNELNKGLNKLLGPIR